MAGDVQFYCIKKDGQASTNPYTMDIGEFIRKNKEDPGNIYMKIKMKDWSAIQCLQEPDGSVHNKYMLDAIS